MAARQYGVLEVASSSLATPTMIFNDLVTRPDVVGEAVCLRQTTPPVFDMSVIEIKKELRKFERPEKAKILCRFFKTGPGEYAEGDQFLGLKTEETRSVAKKFLDLSLYDISELLLSDKEDLIHKAVGWMLREVGRRDQAVLESFLKKNLKKLPRTALRYAIERLPEDKRKAYLKGS